MFTDSALCSIYNINILAGKMEELTGTLGKTEKAKTWDYYILNNSTLLPKTKISTNSKPL